MASSSDPKPPVSHGVPAELSLPARSVHLRSTGIEFLSSEEIPVNKVLNVEIRSPGEEADIQCQGMVARCTGNRHNGYVVSIFFFSLAPEMLQRIQDTVQRRAMR